MKKTIFRLLIIIGLLCVSSFAASWQKLGVASSTTISLLDPFKDNSGVMLFQLEGNANDAGGIYSGTPLNITYGVGKIGNAASFNGSNSSISNSSGRPYINAFSFSVWLKTNKTTRQSLLSWGNGGYSDTIELLDNNTIQVAFSNGTKYAIFSVPNFADGLYHHIVGTSNGASATLYLDNTLYSAPTQTGNTRILSGLLIGTTPQTPQYFFSGSIDQVRIFNRALTQTEVTQLYNEGAQ